MKNQDDSYLKLFTQGLKETLDDMLSLEINTMIVNDIRGFKFNPFTAYEEVYLIPRDEESFTCALGFSTYQNIYQEIQRINQDRQNNKVSQDEAERQLNRQRESLSSIISNIDNDITDLNLCPPIKQAFIKKVFMRKMSFKFLESPEDIKKIINRYVDLREKLELTYCQICHKENISLPEEILPEPSALLHNKIFENGLFLRELRRVRELLFLSGGMYASANDIYDIIYAQTVIQLDGDTINRFHKNLLHDQEHQGFLLHTHQKALEQGQKNWRELIDMVLSTMEKTAQLIGTTIDKTLSGKITK